MSWMRNIRQWEGYTIYSSWYISQGIEKQWKMLSQTSIRGYALEEDEYFIHSWEILSVPHHTHLYLPPFHSPHPTLNRQTVVCLIHHVSLSLFPLPWCSTFPLLSKLCPTSFDVFIILLFSNCPKPKIIKPELLFDYSYRCVRY